MLLMVVDIEAVCGVQAGDHAAVAVAVFRAFDSFANLAGVSSYGGIVEHDGHRCHLLVLIDAAACINRVWTKCREHKTRCYTQVLVIVQSRALTCHMVGVRERRPAAFTGGLREMLHARRTRLWSY